MGLKVYEAACTGDVKRLKAAVNARNVNTINDEVHLFAASEPESESARRGLL